MKLIVLLLISLLFSCASDAPRKLKSLSSADKEQVYNFVDRYYKN